MMSMQARESFRPVIGAHHPLRAYAINSPRAKARLVVLALLADGRLDDREMAALDKRGGVCRPEHYPREFCPGAVRLLR